MHMSHEQAASRSAGIRPRHIERVTAATLTEDEYAEKMKADAEMMRKPKHVTSYSHRWKKPGPLNPDRVFAVLVRPMLKTEISEATGISKSGVADALDKLRRDGRVDNAYVKGGNGPKLYWRTDT